MKKKLVESSLGIRTTEKTARRVDELLRDLPTGQRSLRRKSATVPTEVNTSERTDVSTITTRAMDRDNEIVDPAGIDISDYLTNPIVLFGHDQNKPVGKALWVKSSVDGLIAKTKYASRPKTFQGEWLPDFVFEMVLADVLRGKSIGFLPLEFRDPTPEESANSPGVERVISRSLLLEFSVVSIPSNPKALVEAVNKGLTGSYWNLPVVGKVKPKIIPQPKTKKPAPIVLDPERIARKAVEQILMRWDA